MEHLFRQTGQVLEEIQLDANTPEAGEDCNGGDDDVDEGIDEDFQEDFIDATMPSLKAPVIPIARYTSSAPSPPDNTHDEIDSSTVEDDNNESEVGNSVYK